jgi:hypothetical protein
MSDMHVLGESDNAFIACIWRSFRTACSELLTPPENRGIELRRSISRGRRGERIEKDSAPRRNHWGGCQYQSARHACKDAVVIGVACTVWGDVPDWCLLRSTYVTANCNSATNRESRYGFHIAWLGGRRRFPTAWSAVTYFFDFIRPIVSCKLYANKYSWLHSLTRLSSAPTSAPSCSADRA